MFVYNTGLNLFNTWNTDTHKWALLTTATWSSDHATVADVVAANPRTNATGYADAAASGEVTTINNVLNRVEYTCDNPTWSALGTGTNVRAALLYLFDTDDANSTPIAIEIFPSPGYPPVFVEEVVIEDQLVAYAIEG